MKDLPIQEKPVETWKIMSEEFKDGYYGEMRMNLENPIQMVPINTKSTQMNIDPQISGLKGINMSETYKVTPSVQISSTEYLRLLLQQDQKYRNRMWCIQLEEHLTNMENHQGWIKLRPERELLRKVYEELMKKENENL